jgi:hypothetical protein
VSRNQLSGFFANQSCIAIGGRCGAFRCSGSFFRRCRSCATISSFALARAAFSAKRGNSDCSGDLYGRIAATVRFRTSCRASSSLCRNIRSCRARFGVGGPVHAQLTMTGAGAGAAGLPGPPTFTFQTSANTSCTGAACTTIALAIGTASPNRRVYVDVTTAPASNQTPYIACSIGGVACDINVQVEVSSSNSSGTFLVSAPVPTGTTAVVSLTSTGTAFAFPFVFLYTVDHTTLASITPVTGGATVATGTSVTGSVAVLPGGSLLVGWDCSGCSSSSGSITASDASVGTDATSNFTIAGHVNGVAASAASHVTVGWTTSAEGTLGLMAFR